MAAEGVSDVVERLESSRDLFVQTVADVSEERAVESPGADRWSILQVVEHVATVERGLLASLIAATRSDVSLRDAGKEAKIAFGAANRETRVESPERARPSGRFARLDEALAAFVAARERSIAFAREHEADLEFLSAQHPIFGPVNGHELLLIMAGHSERHSAQIQEIKSGQR